MKVVKEEVGGTGESKSYSTVLETSVVVKGKESQEVIFDDKRLSACANKHILFFLEI